MIDARLALSAVGALPDGEIDLAVTALHFARTRITDPARVEAARVHLSVLARDAIAMSGGLERASAGLRAAALADLLVKKHGYVGDAAQYDRLANANLIRVIERRRGLPVSLGIVWLHCAHILGWGAHGVAFPGHFLIAIEGSGVPAIVDVFDGGTTLGAQDMRAMLQRGRALELELRPGLLQPMDQRSVLLRLQNNIKARRLGRKQVAAALQCLEDMLLIAPDDVGMWQEAALLNRQLCRPDAAISCFERVLSLEPGAAAECAARAAMDELRTRLT